MTGERLVGRRIERLEDGALTTGRARYLDDLTPPGTLHVRFVRSPHASARLGRITLPRDSGTDDGATLVTAADLDAMAIVADVRSEDWQPSSQPVLATSVVRYVGEPVAVVLHPDPYVAEDIAEQVEVEYDVTSAVVDLASALGEDSPRVHETWRDNVFIRRRRSFGDVGAAAERSTQIVRIVTRTHRQAGVPLENRGCLAMVDPTSSEVTLWSSTQVPHLVRTYVAGEVGIPEAQLRVVAPAVGGGFGVKGHVFTEEVVVTALSRSLGRPVKWVEDRSEHLLASIHARDHVHRVEAYVDDRGRIQGLRCQVVVDAGAYSVFPWTAGSDSGMVPKVMLGPYDIQDVEWEDLAVATNKCPVGTYRGVGRPSATFTMERLMDTIAGELDLDPVEVRATNVIREFPYHAANGLLYDDGSYDACLHRAADEIGWGRGGADDGGRYRRGVGIALFNEQTAHGTPDFEVRGTPIETGYVSCRMEMAADGTVTIGTGLQSHGQGLVTTLAQVAAEELGIALRAVRVVHGDTAASPSCVGTWGSRGATLGAGAVAAAARIIRDKLARVAAHRLGTPDVALDPSTASYVAQDGRAVPIAELAYIANRRVALAPDDLEPGLVATAFCDGPPRGTFSNSCHAATVTVDTATGVVSVDRYVVVEDCGTMINPTIVEGQVQGGVVQGIGTALLEEFVYADDGQPLTGTFVNYLLPTAADVPDVEIHHIETPSPWTERGIKGMGEAGAIGPLAAVVSAVSDALGRQLYTTPLSPERVLGCAGRRDAEELTWGHWDAVAALAAFWSPASPE